MSIRPILLRVLMSAFLLFFGNLKATAEILTHTINIYNHRFEPSELKVPSGIKIKLIIVNRDSTAEEFESFELNREKIIAGNSKANIFIGPLKTGIYPFFGEFNMSTAQGRIIAE